MDADLSPRDRAQAQEAAHFEIIGRDGEVAAAQPVHAVNGDGVGAHAVDLRADAVEHVA